MKDIKAKPTQSRMAKPAFVGYNENFTLGRALCSILVLPEKNVCSESVGNVGTSHTVFATTEGTRRNLGVGRIRGQVSCD